MKERIKRALFRLLGKDPEAVVVTFASGEARHTARVATEMAHLVPGRRHFVVSLEPIELVSGELVIPSARSLFGMWRELGRRFRPYRIGLAPVVFDGGKHPLRAVAALLAPLRLLAWNARFERHHLRLMQPVSSLLFLTGVPLDRIFLRPRWLVPWKRDRTQHPDGVRILEGRPGAEGRLRLGVLSPYVPYPLSHGGAVRIYHLLREASRHADVYLFAFLERETAADFEPLLKFCRKLVLVPKPRYREPRWSSLRPPEVCEYDSPRMRALFRETVSAERIERIQIEYTQLAPYGGHILVEHDITQDLYQQLALREPGLSRRWDLWRWRRFEDRALAQFARVVVMSEKDAAWVPARARARVLENGVDLDRFRPQPERAGKRVLFIGSFRHFPNVTAYRFLEREVWPLVLSQEPEARLTAVAGPQHTLYWPEKPAHPGVELLGFISEVRPLYEQANLCVIPTLVSAGTNLKALEAMAMERAIVSTPSGVAGLGLEPERDVLIAEGAAGFASAIVALLRDPARRQSLAASARHIVESRFDWRAIGERQQALYREPIDR